MPETVTELTEVELIEGDRFELPPARPEEPAQRSPIVGSKAVAVASIALIVLALAIMSRPEVSQTVEPDPGQTTSTPLSTSIPFEGNGNVSGATTTRVTQAIPLFDENVPEDLPGVISAIDAQGSLIIIDWTELRPRENRLEMELIDDEPKASLALTGAPFLAVNRDLSHSQTRIVVSNQDRFLDPSFDLADLVPDRTGTALIVSHSNSGQTVTMIPLDWDGVDESAITSWDIPGNAMDVLGSWQGQLLMHQANRIWLLDTDLEATLVADGELLAYNGTHLALLRCDELGACQLLVGTPDAPDTHMVDLPEPLVPLAHRDWVGSIAISPDGSRLGASVRNGALSLPMVIDLTTGESQSLSDGMNHHAPVAWSPDGEWLAYVYTDDVMVWNIGLGRSWRVSVNREMERLMWR
ncbi:MAG: hypothetical protein GY724_08395 [Actinomycetia bacterium]|nr:hypothetical protein [Actinomycetes bacterium]MCP4223923.1 hypothetical protein [Actinomycetes bacterium]